MEPTVRDYQEKGVRFIYVYKTLAHPDWNNYIAPFSIEERLMHIAEAKRTLGTKAEWLCDTMDNELAQALGSAPNSEFIIDPDGVIVRAHGWSNPYRLRRELEELIGPVENPTRLEDLNMPEPEPLAAAPEGVLDPIERPEFMQAIGTTPLVGEDNQPFYVKLRAEVTRDVLGSGAGKLYLGFLLDPLYHVHWNNDVAPIHVEVSAPEGVAVSPASMDAPEVDAASDADPREFLVDVEGWAEDAELTVSVFYFACNDAEGWCRPVRQEYTLARRPARGAGFTFRQQYEQRMLDGLDWQHGEIPEPEVTASDEQIAALCGNWTMNMAMAQEPYTLSLYVEDGVLTGWSGMEGLNPDISVVSFDGSMLRYLQPYGPNPELVEVEFEGDSLRGFHRSTFGDFPISGTRSE